MALTAAGQGLVLRQTQYFKDVKQKADPKLICDGPGKLGNLNTVTVIAIFCAKFDAIFLNTSTWPVKLKEARYIALVT